MKKRYLLIVAAPVLLALGCSSQPTRTAGYWIDPSQAIQLAAASPRLGVTGVFAITVKATGKTYRTHLNSESDYRDQRNLSIAVTPAAAAQLAAQHGAPAEVALRGRRILVAGTARRVRIDFLIDGKPSGKYYYQTHVDVSRASQIQVL